MELDTLEAVVVQFKFTVVPRIIYALLCFASAIGFHGNDALAGFSYDDFVDHDIPPLGGGVNPHPYAV